MFPMTYEGARRSFVLEWRKLLGTNYINGVTPPLVGEIDIKNARMPMRMVTMFEENFKKIYNILKDQGYDISLEETDIGWIIKYNGEVDMNPLDKYVISNPVISESASIITEAKKDHSDTYEGMMINQNQNDWLIRIQNIPLDIDALQKLGYPLEYAKKPQPCIMMGGKKYRARAELLLFNNKGQVLIQPGKYRGGFPYSLCGGGIDDPKAPIAYTAIRECEEEALIVPKNVSFTGIVWKMHYHQEVKSCDGALVFVCIGDYNKPYKGYVKAIDRDSFATKSKWIDVDKVNLGEPHFMAMKYYFIDLMERRGKFNKPVGESVMERIEENGIKYMIDSKGNKHELIDHRTYQIPIEVYEEYKEAIDAIRENFGEDE